MKNRCNSVKFCDPDIVKSQIGVLFPPMDPTERSLTLSVYRCLGKGNAPTPRELADETCLSEETVHEFLEAWSTVSDLDATGRVIGFRGLTLRPTDHLLNMFGRTLFTWCAWDLLFLPGLLSPREKAVAKTCCPVTNEQIRVTVGSVSVESVHPETALVTFPFPFSKTQDQHIRESFCCHTHFLASEDAALEWLKDHPSNSFLFLSEAFDIGRKMHKTLYEARGGRH